MTIAPEIPTVRNLLTVAEASAALRLDPSTLYQKIRAGELSVFRIGSGPKARIRIDARELERFLRPADGDHPSTEGAA